MSTFSMHSALLAAMNPIPPMSAARLYATVAPRSAASQASGRRRSRTVVVDVGRGLPPLADRLDVHRAQAALPAPAESRHQVASDEAAGPGDDDERMVRDGPGLQSARGAVGAPPSGLGFHGSTACPRAGTDVDFA